MLAVATSRRAAIVTSSSIATTCGNSSSADIAPRGTRAMTTPIDRSGRTTFPPSRETSPRTKSASCLSCGFDGR
jgi:hypothetical protein